MRRKLYLNPLCLAESFDYFYGLNGQTGTDGQDWPQSCLVAAKNITNQALALTYIFHGRFTLTLEKKYFDITYHMKNLNLSLVETLWNAGS